MSEPQLTDATEHCEQSRNQLDPSFMYTQIMKEIFLTLKFEQKQIDEFVNHCREAFAGNERQLRLVDKLAHEYRQHTPIWWYTSDCFLYSMLNRALRTMDVDLMIKMGFFISDLHRHIEQLHQKRFSSDNSKQSFTVYRGQAMNKDDFEKIMSNKGGLLSFNTFLSTVKDRSIASIFAESALADDQIVGVLFVMNIDPTRSSTPFASVADVGYFSMDEDEVLFSTHTIFRIGEITPMDSNPRLVQVQINLTSDRDNDLCDLIDHIRQETFPDEEGWFRLGALLLKMGESAKAEQIYKALFTQEIKESAKASIYHQLGRIKQEQGEYAEAIAYYEKLIQIKEKQTPRDDQGLTSSYSHIGSVYFAMGDHPKALSSHEKALAIKQQALPPTHPDLASSYSQIGEAYYSMGDHSKALVSLEKALAIKQQSLPSNHPDLASSYSNIGSVYYDMGDYSKALASYEKVLAIKQQSLPPNHPGLASTYDSIGLVYQKLGDNSKAHSCFERAVDIGQRCLPPNHPDLEKWKKHLADNK